jgi:hypothetical protein
MFTGGVMPPPPEGFAQFSSIGRRHRSVAWQSRPALRLLVDFFHDAGP